jgi:hypothetical protein
VNARIALGAHEVGIDLSRPLSLAVELDFAGAQPRHFGAPRASARPFEAPGFSGSVARGASCNCEVISLIPHCNGTHTECVGHLTRERLDASRVAPLGLLPALLLTLEPEPAGAGGEGSEPEPRSGDLLITARALQRAWPRALPLTPAALIVRTLPNAPDKRGRDYSQQNPPYLSREAAALLVARRIAHLVVDLPSIDRAHDAGRLTAHRVFFGLPAGATELKRAARPAATVTELAFVPAEARDGACLLELQLPALAGDAVPSRPLLYPLLS